MTRVRGTPRQGLFAATLGFFVGFSAVALFGPTAHKFQDVMHLSPLLVGLLVGAPALSGALLRIPFAAWADSNGGRTPFLVLLVLSILGMAGVFLTIYWLYPQRLSAGLYPVLLLLGVLCGCGIATFSVGVGQVSYWYPQRRQGRALAIFAGVGNLAPGAFSVLLPVAFASLGLGGSYLCWLGFLVAGTIAYAFMGRSAWYFQLLGQGVPPADARPLAAQHGQTLFPAGSLMESLRASARIWRTWALVWIYFTSFGGFIGLTAWLPIYWTSFYGLSTIRAGLLTAAYALLTSAIRVVGGMLSDQLREGGENTAILALFIMLAGALVMTSATQYELAIPGLMLLAFGMGVCNAAVFKLVPQEVPQAVGGAAGWIGGLGALGGFVIPPVLGFAVSDLGQRGYAIGFVVFIFLALFSLSMAWILKYTRDVPTTAAPSPLTQDMGRAP